MLAAGDHASYVVVGRFGKAPVLRFRTVLDDGAVVETVSVAKPRVLRPRGQDPFAGFTLAVRALVGMVCLVVVAAALLVGTRLGLRALREAWWWRPRYP